MARRRKTRRSVERDRLSNLPDDLIHKVISFIGIKQAIQTSALSSRWRYLWTSNPSLDFSSEDFNSLTKFSKFVTHVLSARNNQTEAHSVKLAFTRNTSQAFVKRILKHAFSHNVQQLNITCLPGKEGFQENLCESPLSVFSSRSLKNLTLSGYGFRHFVRIPPTWYLPALETLNLICVALFDDNTPDKCACLFSSCANLKNLSLNNCKLMARDYHDHDMNIYHDGLSFLTLEDSRERIKVVTPQLKNLTVINSSGIHLVSAPNLTSLRYKNDKDNIYATPLKVSSDLLRLEKADVCFQRSFNDEEYTHKIVCLLQQLRSVKFLTLNLELVKLLSSSMERIPYQPSPFTNLKSLKIYQADVTEPEITMSTEVKHYLLDSSQCATFTLVSYEEARAVMNVASARNLMRELQVLLDQWKKNSETKTARVKKPLKNHTKTESEQVEVDTSIKCRIEGMTHINERFKKGFKSTGQAISMMRKIEGVLAKLPASHRDKLQVSFSSLCAEAEACYKK